MILIRKSDNFIEIDGIVYFSENIDEIVSQIEQNSNKEIKIETRKKDEEVDEIIDIKFIENENYRKTEYQKKLQQINLEFDAKIDAYLSKYPKREQDTFSEKKREAEKVVNGESSLYIEGKAKALGITSLEFAQIVIAKNNEWTELYLEAENEKDIELEKLKDVYL
jgi:hypothetical protein